MNDNSPSVLHTAKSALKHMERQPSVYSQNGYRSSTKLLEEEPVHVDFRRFNEDLEDMVQYRERDEGGRQMTARNQ